MSGKIRVAISGGGVAGATVLHALLKYPHLDPHIFESATQFKEAGVAFGFARNATKALSLISPSARRCLELAGGVPMRGVRIYMGQGKDAGDLIYEADNEVHGKPTTTIVQRGDLLRELLADTPPERMHASKKLEAIERTDQGIDLLFDDGSTHTCDILIGADGIRSTVRKLILGPDDPTAHPRNSGWWAIMTLQPYEKARASIGKTPVDIEDAREIGWVGDGTLMMHNLLSNGSLVQFTIVARDEAAEGTDRWHTTVSAKQLKERYIGTGWSEHLARAVDELLCDSPETGAFYLWEHQPARTYVDGRVCVMGDAAHATTPFQAAGGGMCIEDSLILSVLLGRARSPGEAVMALRIYNEFRLPRTQQVVRSSLEIGRIITGIDHYAGLDPSKLREKTLPRWDFIIDFDNEKHRDEAIRALEAEIAKEVKV